MATKSNTPARPETLARIDWLSLVLFLSPIGIAFAVELAR